MTNEHDSTVEDHVRGLSHDLPRLISRRRAIAVLAGGLGSAALAACGASQQDATGTPDAASGGTTEIPDETAGPFPGDGSNGPNVLTESGVVRSDIRSSIGGASGLADGVPTTIEMTLLDVAAGGTPLAGAAVYIWHCDVEGRYSMYDGAIAGENYLRGVQQSDADGKLAFTTVFPGAYAGRWPHVHFEVYESVDAATAAGSRLKTSQIALPAETCELVYATAGYEQSAENLSRTSLETDNVFADGYAGQLAAGSGSVDEGIAIRLNVGV